MGNAGLPNTHAGRWAAICYEPLAGGEPIVAGRMRMRLRKREKASQLSNMRSPMRRNVTCSRRPARALRPNALSAIRSNA